MADKIDLYVLDRVFEPAAAFAHARMGVGNYALAKWLLYVGTALFVVIGIMAEINGQAGFIALLEVIYAWPAMSLATRLQEHWKGDALPPNLRDALEGTKEHRIVSRRKRALYLPIAILLVFTIVFPLLKPFLPAEGPAVHSGYNFWAMYGVSWILVISGFYFLSCTPLPPKKREQKVPAQVKLQTVRT